MQEIEKMNLGKEIWKERERQKNVFAEKIKVNSTGE